MNTPKAVLGRKIKTLKDSTDKVILEGVKLKERLLRYANEPITQSKHNDMQSLINAFIRDNNLKIEVSVYVVDSSINIIGDDFASEVVWSFIMNYNEI